jgi:hypothetical protein
VGSKVKSSPQNDVALRVRVQSPAWFDVDRVEIYRNGSLRWIFEGNEQGDQCQGPQTQWPCEVEEPVAGFQVRRCECIPTEDGHNTDVVNLDVTFADRPDKDSWYVAVAMASDMGARTMSPIQTWRYYPHMSFGLMVNKALGAIDLGLDIESFVEPTPMTAQVSPVVPYAATNPIWVDRDGGPDEPFHFDAPGPYPRWMSNFQKSRRSYTAPTSSGADPSAIPATGTPSSTGDRSWTGDSASTAPGLPPRLGKRHWGGHVKRLRRADVRAYLQEGLNKHLLRAVRSRLEERRRKLKGNRH